MKTLVGIINYGGAKMYMFPKLIEMLESCIFPIPGVTVMWATDLPAETASQIYPGDVFYEIPEKGLTYAEDMLMHGREAFRQLAIEDGYDAMLWQGVDAPWMSREDVERILKMLEEPDVAVAAPLISARDDGNFAIARRYVHTEGQFSEFQVNIPAVELSSGDVIHAGFPGADNIALRKDTFDISWKDGHIQWYRRVVAGSPNLCFEEWLLRELSNRGQVAWLDTAVKVWHVHEDCVARMWPGIEKPLSDLSWD